MVVRVKYCGGCNPRFDRKAVVEKLRASHPEIEFVETGEGPFDWVFVIAGCPASCALHEDLDGEYGKLVVSSEEDCDRLDEALSAGGRDIDAHNTGLTAHSA